MMSYVDIEKLLEKAGSIYKLVNLASQRASALNEGSPKLIDTNSKSNTTIALEEIKQGKIGMKLKEGKE